MRSTSAEIELIGEVMKTIGAETASIRARLSDRCRARVYMRGKGRYTRGLE